MSEINDLIDKIIKFRDERDWKQFHNPKDLALSLVLEAGEVMEHFQWKNEEQIKEYIETHREEIAEELADTMYWILLMSKDMGIDIKTAVESKLKKNEVKYPIEKAKGSAKKYTEL